MTGGGISHELAALSPAPSQKFVSRRWKPPRRRVFKVRRLGFWQVGSSRKDHAGGSVRQTPASGTTLPPLGAPSPPTATATATAPLRGPSPPTATATAPLRGPSPPTAAATAPLGPATPAVSFHPQPLKLSDFLMVDTRGGDEPTLLGDEWIFTDSGASDVKYTTDYSDDEDEYSVKARWCNGA